MKEDCILLKYSLKNKIMNVLTKEKTKELIKVKIFKINTLEPNFKFKNEVGNVEKVKNCYILV
mgnify:CR=1 FL=1